MDQMWPESDLYELEELCSGIIQATFLDLCVFDGGWLCTHKIEATFA